MTSRKRLAVALATTALLASGVTDAVAQTPAEQLRKDTAALHALGISGDTLEHMLEQEKAAGALVDHALCGRAHTGAG
ncbi:MULTISPECIES: hypothetical protein [Streptomyces]|uniref:hypothetical protein n=1 Tax=Streptomyces TaxID=1883 RepID=UPI000F78E49F|nr:MULTISPECIES: hypothetical protein [Streptomyces]RST06198.1 hypothetical protein EF910_10760 [Streptomyces sp. WAC07149]GLX17866.1 hypothetical protein Slala01_15100 [Streptomyces lavendulae subsp. lavendulae]GLX26210.1 hypothetical protein Slala02_20300 [Streptomyces lavendulae subsp. lavendulae]